MDHTLLPFAVIVALLLCGCAPLCSSKRQAVRAKPSPRTPPAHGLSKNTAQASLPIRSGDIVFITLPYYLCGKIADATSSPANHVGIAFHDPARGWLVAESGIPLSRYTPLEKFLARSKDGWYEIRRLKTGLNEAQVAKLRAACDARMGIAYHTGFRYESRRMFCSKFVYEVYESALGVRVGELETFSHLLNRNPGANLAFWKAWYFGRIPWDRLTVTPASQLRSPTLKTVCRS